MKKRVAGNRTRDEVINFRANSDLVEVLDAIAVRERRTRANLIEFLLEQDTNIARAVSVIETIVSLFYEEIGRGGRDTPQSEFLRGQLHGAKWMLSELRGASFKYWVLDEARKRIKKPFPHTIALAPDGNRYGWDSDADMDGP